MPGKAVLTLCSALLPVKWARATEPLHHGIEAQVITIMGKKALGQIHVESSFHSARWYCARTTLGVPWALQIQWYKTDKGSGFLGLPSCWEQETHIHLTNDNRYIEHMANILM